MFQTVTSHWVKAGRWREEKRYRMGSPILMEYLQGFPSWWAPNLRGTERYAAIADAIPPLYVYYLFRNKFKYEPSRILDLYAGIAGWALGIALYTSKPFYYEAVERDRIRCRAIETSLRLLSKYHYYTIDYNVICSDVNEYTPSARFDLVVGSPPCEDASNLRHIAKGRESGTYPLTQRYLEIAERVRPFLAVYENVPDQLLESILREAGYTVEVHDMSTVLPQTRKRLIAYRYFLWA